MNNENVTVDVIYNKEDKEHLQYCLDNLKEVEEENIIKFNQKRDRDLIRIKHVVNTYENLYVSLVDYYIKCRLFSKFKISKIRNDISNELKISAKEQMMSIDSVAKVNFNYYPEHVVKLLEFDGLLNIKVRILNEYPKENSKIKFCSDIINLMKSDNCLLKNLNPNQVQLYEELLGQGKQLNCTLQ